MQDDKGTTPTVQATSGLRKLERNVLSARFDTSSCAKLCDSVRIELFDAESALEQTALPEDVVAQHEQQVADLKSLLEVRENRSARAVQRLLVAEDTLNTARIRSQFGPDVQVEHLGTTSSSSRIPQMRAVAAQPRGGSSGHNLAYWDGVAVGVGGSVWSRHSHRG